MFFAGRAWEIERMAEGVCLSRLVDDHSLLTILATACLPTLAYDLAEPI